MNTNNGNANGTYIPGLGGHTGDGASAGNDVQHKSEYVTPANYNIRTELLRLNIALGFDSTAIITDMPRTLARYVNLLRAGKIRGTEQSETILSQVNDCIELRGNDKETDFEVIEQEHREEILKAITNIS